MLSIPGFENISLPEQDSHILQELAEQGFVPGILHQGMDGPLSELFVSKENPSRLAGGCVAATALNKYNY